MPNINTNRWQLASIKDGIVSSLSEAKSKLASMYSDSTSTLEDRNKQQEIVQDLTERLTGITNQINEIDAQVKTTENENMSINDAFGGLVRAVMTNSSVSANIKNALKDDSTTGGDKLLPKTVSSQIITEPFAKNPLRKLSTVTAIENLELPKMAFTLSDDDFIEDGATAKELASTADTITFTRNKFKVFCDISETVLKGSNSNIGSYVNRALESGLMKKEKKVALATTPKSGEEHMSFYSTVNNIKKVGGSTLYTAIKNSVADLEEDYLDNCTILMSRADYLSIIETLANSSKDLFGKTPEEVLGYPVEFCDLATKPIVGDFSYSQYNYSPDMIYESDKNVKTGMNSFVLTAWLDHRIKLSSAFRIADVESV